jgi:hypothetical protein
LEKNAASIIWVEDAVVQKREIQLEEIWDKNWSWEVKGEQKCLRRTRI